jgi:hypothetical protein
VIYQGVALIVVGIVFIVLRQRSGRLGARVHNAAFNTDRFKPGWISAWNLLVGCAAVVGGVVMILLA